MTSREDAPLNFGAETIQAGEKNTEDALLLAIHRNDQMAVKLEAVRRELHIPPEKV